uniref:Putative alpha beta-hydrolase n=1 Tax=Moniliophthora roreri TaxID=221103 RepID=A0A0W0GE63_MONRR
MPHNAYAKRSLRRILFDAAGRYVTGTASVKQLQWVSPTSLQTYEAWTKKHGKLSVVESIDENARILWLGSRTAPNVLIYIHGDGFMLRISDLMLTFWDLVQSRQKWGLSVAILDYSLYPAPFPTQLTELIHAINHIQSYGSRDPFRIQLAGDSCGANIILQFMLHVLHPIPGVPPAPPFPVSSAVLISPWISLDERTPSQSTNNADALDAATLRRWGEMHLGTLRPLSKSFDPEPYLKIQHAPLIWLQGVKDKAVKRILITTGTTECLEDDAMEVYNRLKSHYSDEEIQLDVREGGVHDDPIFDIGAGSMTLNDVGEKIADWIDKSNV